MNSALVTKIEANRKEFERLLKDSDYIDVRFNPINGALVAVHKEHHFDPTIGKFGIARGDYERISLEVLFDYGKTIVLDSEYTKDGIKTPDGFLDGKYFEIKGIEGIGGRNIIDKISDAGHQGAESLVLYYHDSNMFDLQKIINSYKGYSKLSFSKKVKNVYYIVDKKLYKI